ANRARARAPRVDAARGGSRAARAGHATRAGSLHHAGRAAAQGPPRGAGNGDRSGGGARDGAGGRRRRHRGGDRRWQAPPPRGAARGQEAPGGRLLPRGPPDAGGGAIGVNAPDPRGVAHEVLVRVATTAAFADVLLARRLAGAALSSADRALATELVYGTLAWQGRIDHHLAQLVHGSLAGLDPPVRAALRIGLYQLLFLDRTPAYAAVDASVRLARRGGGLANAVLRRAARVGRDGLALPDGAADPVGRLAVEWSHPRWLVERPAEQVGAAEPPGLLAAHNLRRPGAPPASAAAYGPRAELS